MGPMSYSIAGKSLHIQVGICNGFERKACNPYCIYLNMRNSLVTTLSQQFVIHANVDSQPTYQDTFDSETYICSSFDIFILDVVSIINIYYTEESYV